jgi:pimeloyl-ACP methyl ester carboxylesterase
MNLRITRIQGADGLDLAVRRWQPDPPRLLLVHGFGDGGFVWEPFVRRLPQTLPAAAVDLRGHGDSARDPTGRYALETHARDVECVLNALGSDDWILVGHSIGAHVATLVAAANQSRVRALVLVDSGPELKPQALEYLYEQFRAQPWRYRSVAELAHALSERLPLARGALLPEFANNALRAASPGVLELKCDPALKDSPKHMNTAAIWAALEELRCPILVVRGAASAVLTYDAAVRLSQSLPRCELVTVPMAGHAVLLDNAAGCAAAVQSFIDKVMRPMTGPGTLPAGQTTPHAHYITAGGRRAGGDR